MKYTLFRGQHGGYVYRDGITMSKLKCVIHYKHLGDNNEEITTLNEATFKKLQDSAEARRTLGGEYIHKEQIDNLPDSLDSETMVFTGSVIRNSQMLCPF